MSKFFISLASATCLMVEPDVAKSSDCASATNDGDTQDEIRDEVVRRLATYMMENRNAIREEVIAEHPLSRVQQDGVTIENVNYHSLTPEHAAILEGFIDSRLIEKAETDLPYSLWEIYGAVRHITRLTPLHKLKSTCSITALELSQESIEQADRLIAENHGSLKRSIQFRIDSNPLTSRLTHSHLEQYIAAEILELWQEKLDIPEEKGAALFIHLKSLASIEHFENDTHDKTPARNPRLTFSSLLPLLAIQPNDLENIRDHLQDNIRLYATASFTGIGLGILLAHFTDGS